MRVVGLVGGVPVCFVQIFLVVRRVAGCVLFERRRVAVSRIGDALSALGFPAACGVADPPP